MSDEDQPVTIRYCKILHHAQSDRIDKLEVEMNRQEGKIETAVNRFDSRLEDYLKEQRSQQMAVRAQLIGIIVTISILILQWAIK